MSNGTANTGYWQHTIVNLIMTTISMIVMSGYYQREVWVPIVIGMAFSTIWLNPDIDSDTSKTYRNWWILKFYWYFYTELFSHSGRSYPPLEVKRGIGHNVLLGTTIRLICASPLFIVSNLLIKASITSRLLFFFGIWLADCLHILIDFIYHKN